MSQVHSRFNSSHRQPVIQNCANDAARFKEIDDHAIAIRREAALRLSIPENERDYEDEESVEPPIPRQWRRTPQSVLSSSLTRQDWFRVLHWNMMTDRWTTSSQLSGGAVSPATTTPVVPAVVPSHTEGGELPSFLTREHRCKHLVQLLRAYDPDVITLNEVNREFFDDEIFKYVRFLGYGVLYQSSRGARVVAKRRGEGDGASLAYRRLLGGKIERSEDIGNLILFHKGRFIPMLSGGDLGGHFHFAHFAALRDRVTNLSLLLACVQFTAGNTALAREVRHFEAQQTLTLLEAFDRHGTDRCHQTTLICGDFNAEDMEEPCVTAVREKFFSAYDLAGGPRWTTWHHSAHTTLPPSASLAAGYAKYFQKNVAEYQRCSAACQASSEMERHIQYRKEAEATVQWMASIAARDGSSDGTAQAAALPPPPASAAVTASLPASCSPWEWCEKPQECGGKEAAQSDQEARDGDAPSSLVRVEGTELESRSSEDRLIPSPIVRRTQDFMFYDPNRLAIHQLLDIVEDDVLDEKELLPCERLPSHHIPLVMDVSFNVPNPTMEEKLSTN